MKTQRYVVSLLGFLVILVLMSPAVGASHIPQASHVWNDAGINTRLVSPLVWFWNDAGLNTGPAQTNTTDWNDVAWGTRSIPETMGWNDAGANSERL